MFVNVTAVMMQSFISDDYLIPECEACTHKNPSNVCIGIFMKIVDMEGSLFMFR
jgi:hypothetical protein